MTRAVSEIDVVQLNELIAARDDIVFVDVRESEEYASGHIPGAIAVPLGTLDHAVDATSIARNDALLQAWTTTLVVYCDDGRRSRVAADQLHQFGCPRVHWLIDGLNGWQSNGLPLLHK